MGRPIKKRFFGDNRFGTGRVGIVGGEGIAAVVIGNTATNSGYSTTTVVTWSASTSTQITGGVAATGTAVVSAAGRIQSLTISNAGTGFISTSGVTIVYSPASAGTAATFTASLTAGRRNAITFASYLSTVSGTPGAVIGGDIIKQEGSRSYLVQNSQGRGRVKLVATATNSLAKGQMNMTATDFFGAVYLVSKLSARKANVVRYQTGTNGTYLVATGPAKWTTATATGTTLSITVTI
jgi:hypothetical protein